MSAPAFLARVINDAAPTSPGTVSYTIPGFGTPAGAVVLASQFGVVGTIKNGWAQSWGVTDGTNQRVCYSYARNAVATGVSKAAGHNALLIRILNPTSGSVLLEGSFAGWVTDGISINWTVVSPSAHPISIALLGGTQCSCFAGDATPPITTGATTVTPGFAADFVLTHTMGSTDGSLVNQADHGPGFCSANAGSPINYSAQMLCDRSTTSQARTVLSNTVLGETISVSASDVVTGTTRIANFTATTFDLVNDNSLQGPSFAMLAVKVGGAKAVRVAVNETTGPTATGAVAYTFPGFSTGFLYCLFSNSTAIGTANDAAGGVGFSDIRSASGSVSVYGKSGVSTSKTSALISSALIDQYDADRTQQEVAVPLSVDALGHSLNFTSAPAAGRKFFQLAIEEITDLLAWISPEPPLEVGAPEIFDSFFAPFAASLISAAALASGIAPLDQPGETEQLGAFARPIDVSQGVLAWAAPEAPPLAEPPAEQLGSADGPLDSALLYSGWSPPQHAQPAEPHAEAQGTFDGPPDSTAGYQPWQSAPAAPLPEPDGEPLGSAIVPLLSPAVAPGWLQLDAEPLITEPPPERIEGDGAAVGPLAAPALGAPGWFQLDADSLVPEPDPFPLAEYDLRWRVSAGTANAAPFWFFDALDELAPEVLGAFDSAPPDDPRFPAWLWIDAAAPPSAPEPIESPADGGQLARAPSFAWFAPEPPAQPPPDAALDGGSPPQPMLPPAPNVNDAWMQPDSAQLPELAPLILGSSFAGPTLAGSPGVVAGFWEAIANEVRLRMQGAVGVPVEFDSAPFGAPAGAWVRLGFMAGDQRPVSVGAGVGFRVEGVVYATVKCPLAAGDGAASAIASAISAAFARVRLSTCRFLDPREAKKRRAGAWWEIELELPFRADRISSAQLISSGSPDGAGAASIARARFRSQIEVALGIQTQYDDMVMPARAAPPWARVFVVLGSERALDGPPGAQGYRQSGLLIAHVLGSSIAGDGSLLRIVDSIDNAFRAVAVGGVLFGAPSPETRGREGRWWRIDVSCPFSFDSVS